jgi:type III secretory pathway component EscT
VDEAPLDGAAGALVDVVLAEVLVGLVLGFVLPTAR